jgi:hypothetical protein
MPSRSRFVPEFRPARTRARAAVIPCIAVALGAAIGPGCRTPWSVQPLPVDRLEKGMPTEAVRDVLGEPGRIDASRGPEFPETWPGLSTSSGVDRGETWYYEDEKVDRPGLGLTGLAFPLTLPIQLVSATSGADAAERDCLWIDEREIALYFEDERLAGWVVTTKPERGWCANEGNWQGTDWYSMQDPAWSYVGSSTWRPSECPTPPPPPARSQPTPRPSPPR